MKQITLLSLGIILLFGCSRTDKIEPTLEGLYEVNFVANEFKTSVSPLEKLSSISKNAVTQSTVVQLGRPSRIRFVVFSSNGDIVIDENRSAIPYLNEENTDEFWKFNLKLAKGTYRLGVVLFSDEDDYLIEIKNNIDGDHQLSLREQQEVFSKGFTEFIVEGDSTYSPVELHRLNGCLMVEITDPVKVEAAHLRITFLQYGYINPFVSNLYTGEDENYFYKSVTYNLKDSVGKVNTVYPAEVFPQSTLDESNFSIIVSLLDSKYDIIGSKTIEQVPIKTNFRTKLSGSIFDLVEPTVPEPEDPTNQSGFTINVNSIFNDEIIDMEFD